jgi:hypothetical protein
MICCIVFRPARKSKRLPLERSKQWQLSETIKAEMNCSVFIFNYTDIIYIFFEDEIEVSLALKLTTDFMTANQSNPITLFDASGSPNYFWNEVKNKLSSNEISAFEWKHFISSFLIQLDPFNVNKSGVGIDVFEQFRDLIKVKGSNKQKKYFKNKLAILRKRVSLESLSRFLKK